MKSFSKSFSYYIVNYIITLNNILPPPLGEGGEGPLSINIRYNVIQCTTNGDKVGNLGTPGQ